MEIEFCERNIKAFTVIAPQKKDCIRNYNNGHLIQARPPFLTQFTPGATRGTKLKLSDKAGGDSKWGHKKKEKTFHSAGRWCSERESR